MMKYLKRFENWTYTSSIPNVISTYDFISKDKVYYGIHNINVMQNNKTVQVSAKFDTGARSSSMDFSVAKKLGISNELIEECKKLDDIKVPKDISLREQRVLERKLSTEIKSKFPDVTIVQLIKSSSGFSLRAYIRCRIEYFGTIVETDINLRDRTGLKADLLVGLKDMA